MRHVDDPAVAAGVPRGRLSLDVPYLNDYDDLVEARTGIRRYLEFYNNRRQHQALGYQAPASSYDCLISEAA